MEEKDKWITLNAYGSLRTAARERALRLRKAGVLMLLIPTSGASQLAERLPSPAPS